MTGNNLVAVNLEFVRVGKMQLKAGQDLTDVYIDVIDGTGRGHYLPILCLPNDTEYQNYQPGQRITIAIPEWLAKKQNIIYFPPPNQQGPEA